MVCNSMLWGLLKSSVTWTGCFAMCLNSQSSLNISSPFCFAVSQNSDRMPANYPWFPLKSEGIQDMWICLHSTCPIPAVPAILWIRPSIWDGPSLPDFASVFSICLLLRVLHLNIWELGWDAHCTLNTSQAQITNHSNLEALSCCSIAMGPSWTFDRHISL